MESSSTGRKYQFYRPPRGVELQVSSSSDALGTVTTASASLDGTRLIRYGRNHFQVEPELGGGPTTTFKGKTVEQHYVEGMTDEEKLKFKTEHKAFLEEHREQVTRVYRDEAAGQEIGRLPQQKIARQFEKFEDNQETAATAMASGSRRARRSHRKSGRNTDSASAQFDVSDEGLTFAASLLDEQETSRTQEP